VHRAIEAFSATRREILSHLKQRGGASISELAQHLGISDEGTRQHLIHLERNGWVVRVDSREQGGRSGRPASLYSVSTRGEAFFPKEYDELARDLLEAVSSVYGDAALEAIFARITEKKVRRWTSRLRGKTLEQKIELLKNYYRADDEFATVDRKSGLALVERNCPYLAIAHSTPAVCRATENALGCLLGFEVRRRRTFQNGDGCCEFEVRTNRPLESPEAALVTAPTPGAPDEE
jgi:predicted ArsR family transcriptional regulator